jgi:hypothetical protein
VTAIYKEVAPMALLKEWGVRTEKGGDFGRFSLLLQ